MTAREQTTSVKEGGGPPLPHVGYAFFCVEREPTHLGSLLVFHNVYTVHRPTKLYRVYNQSSLYCMFHQA